MRINPDEEGFEDWYENNKGSEEFYDRYLNCCDDIEYAGEEAPTFRQWMHGVWEKREE